MAQQVANFSLARLFESIFFSSFLLFVGGFGLFLMGELYRLAVEKEGKKLNQLASIVSRIFPFPDKKYEFNLSHVVLFSMLIALLCMLHHPAQDVIQHEVEKEEKKVAKTKEADKRRQKREEKKEKEAKESKKEET
mmetsp:Transcript_92596/g.164645  ORF Transcript_92596/g.164645 Transcript_92596/m.164645 type:complete len:136 (-) Transcript_92596:49-456(-)|eukprot:CAMPEP_0197654080 /NCGR_PEP_ID=MMETSP1338-20131121/38628_1 /TAXON_ID=43686 ORGANISM="Pelagodinium beii, Strain RCC1491" /NCGR_SAMPLE_ID=MMETSP1338 /ASSEMBLY_ACC=CAM_ASM_000754 /LENGTH=135 /DNA_ID=CAMNT_0043229459 /DNA_START=50 /DNA_END=457 /DNA_ORIENTATION=+